MKINKNIIISIIIGAFIVQLVIISYNHLTGYLVQRSILTLAISLTYATALSTFFAILLFAIDFRIINYLNKKLPWSKKFAKRIPLELVASLISVIIPAIMLTMIANLIVPYSDGLQHNIINNLLISSVINVLLMLIIEASVFYNDWKNVLQKASDLEKQNMISQLESLKNQLNPHFLFNSLNVLSSLISRDPKTAELFITEFAKIYRYVLDTSELQLIETEKEINFCISFLKLQKYRFGDGIQYKFEESNLSYSTFVPPLSIQLIVENSVKHNSTSTENPLFISSYFENNKYLVVKNNYQPRINDENSFGMGINNIKKRFSFFSDDIPLFYIEDGFYYAKLPLIIED